MALKNALDHLYRKPGDKSAAIISYGAPGEGYRASVLRMVPVRKRVGVPLARQAFDAQEQPHGQWLEHAVDAILNDLMWQATMLKMSRGGRDLARAA